MQESQDLRLRVECDYDPLKEFNRSWWYMNRPLRELYPLKKDSYPISLCPEVPNLVFSDPKRSTHGLQGSTSHLTRHTVFSASVYVHSFGESLWLPWDLQRIWDPKKNSPVAQFQR